MTDLSEKPGYSGANNDPANFNNDILQSLLEFKAC